MSKGIKILFAAALVGCAGYFYERNKKIEEMQKDILDLNTGEGDAHFFKTIFFPKATFNELAYLHKFLVFGIRPKTPEQFELHNNIWFKYNLDEQQNLGNPMVIGLVAKMIPYLLLAGGGLFAYSKVKDLFDGSRSESLDRKKWELTDEFGINYNAMDIAVRYRAAMDGPGTSEQTLFDLAKISRGTRFSNISTVFRKITKETLTRRLEDELSDYDLSKFNNIKNNVASPNSNSPHYEFGINEDVEVGSSLTDYVYYKKSNGKWVKYTGKFYNQYGGNNMGRILSRVKLTPKGQSESNNYYTTTEYPYRYILGAALNRL